MSDIDTLSDWIIANQDKKGTADFQTVAAALIELSEQDSGEDEVDRIEAERAKLRAEMEAPEREAPKVYEDDPFYEDIIKGFGAGAVDTLESAALGTAAIAGEETETELRDSIQSIAKGLRPDVDPESTWGKVAGGLGSAAAFIAPALVAAVSLPATAAAAVGTGIAGALGLSAAAGEASERARAADATEEQRTSATFSPAVAAAGAIEILPLGRFVKAIHVPFISDLVNKVGPEVVNAASNRVTNAIASGGVEAAQEVTSEILQNLNEKYGYNPDRNILQDAGLVEAGEIGFTTGFILDALSGRKVKKTDKKLGVVTDEGFFPTEGEVGEQGELFQTRGKSPYVEEEGVGFETAEDRGDVVDQLEQEETKKFTDLAVQDLATQGVQNPSKLEIADKARELRDAEAIRTEARQDPAQPDLFNLEGDPTRQTAEDAAQKEAREREGEEALERGDQAAFEQPSLFALEEEQKQRTLGRPIFPSDQFMDERVDPFGERAPATVEETQTELEDLIAGTPKKPSAREIAESETETISGQLDTQQRKTTEARRTAILQDVIENNIVDDTLANNFSKELARQGIGNTTPTAAELNTIQRAIDFQRAEKPALEEAGAKEFQVVDGKRLPRTEIPSLEKEVKPKAVLPQRIEGLPAAATEDVTPVAEPAVEPAVEPEKPVDKVTADVTPDKELTKEEFGEKYRKNFARRAFLSANKKKKELSDRLSKVQKDNDRGKYGVLSRELDKLLESDKSIVDNGLQITNKLNEMDTFVKDRETTPVPVARPESPTPEKKSTRVTKRAAGPKDPVEKIGKTLGFTTKDVKERVKERTKTATKKVAADKKRRAETKAKLVDKKEDKSVLDKAVEVSGKAKAKRDIKKEIEKDVKFYNALSLRSKTKKKLDVFDEKETAAGRITLKEARVEANELDFYINEYPDQDVNTAFTQDELTKVKELISQPIKERKQKYPQEDKTGRAAANLYFIKNVNPRDAIDNIAHDIVFSNDQFRLSATMSPAERIYFNQTGAKNAMLAAKWIRDNLGKSKATMNNLIKEEAKALQGQLTRYNKLETMDDVEIRRQKEQKKAQQELLQTQQMLKDNYKFTSSAGKTVDEMTNIDYEEATSTLSLTDLKELLLPSSEVLALDSKTHPVVKSLLKQGKLKEALSALSITTKNDRLSQVAKGLSNVTGDTKVEIVSFLTNDSDVEVAGLFDPKTNTIKLNAETGLNPHVILHEMTHAATSATLANKSSPVTKQLNTLFNDIKDMLGTAYGSTNLDEFVSEAFSNPEFQKRLAGIHYKSEISGWQRFVNTVSNFVRQKLGMQTKDLDTALNASDVLIKKILYPSPATRNADVLEMSSTPEGIKKVMNTIGNTINQKVTPEQRKKFRFEVEEFFRSNITDKAKGLLLKLSGSQGLGEIAQSVGFGDKGHRLDKLLLRQRGGMYASDAKVEKVVDQVVAWSKNAGEATTAALDRVIYNQEYGSTIHQVDPTLTRSEAQTKYKNDAEKMVVWDKQRKDWDSLGDKGKEMYTLMRDTYKAQYLELQKVINGEVDDLLKSDPASAKRLKNEVLAKLFDKTTLDVYFPLMREGKYKLAYTPKDPTTNKTADEAYTVLMFETKGERDAAKDALDLNEVDKDSIQTEDGDITYKSFNQAPPTSFVGETLNILNTSKMATTNQKDVQETQDAIMRMFIDMLPQTSFAKSLQRRKGTIGYMDDSIRALKTKAYDLGRQTEKIRYGSQLRVLEQEIFDQKLPKDLLESKSFVGKTQKKLTASFEQVKAELLSRGKFGRMGANNKGIEKYAKLANQVAFTFTIGTNPSSAIVNLSQIPLFVYPYLGAKYGYKESYHAVTGARSIVTGSLPTSKQELSTIKKKLKGFVDFGLDNYYNVDKDGNFTLRDDLSTEKKNELKDLAPLVKTAYELGLLGRSTILESMGVEESGREVRGRPLTRGLDRTSSTSAIFFNSAERFNRQVTLVSTYKLALNDINTKPRFYDSVKGEYVNTKDLSTEQRQALAVSESVYQTQQTNGGSVLETAPSIAQQNVGRVAMMYKSYGMNMYYTMLRSAKIALDSEADPELRAIARKQLIGVHGSAAFFAGVHGVPIYGLVTMLMDLFLDDEEEDADTIIRNAIGEPFYKGAIALAGIDVSDRIKLTDLLFQENRFNTDPSAEEFIGGLVGGPALSIAKRFGRGVSNIGEGQIERGIENFMPAGISNLYKTTFGRYQREGGIYNKRGDPLYDNMNGFEMIGQAFGFAPTGYTYNQELNGIKKGIDKSVNARRSKLLKKYYVALRMGDSGEDILEEILKFNKRHPTFAIGGDSIQRSMKMHAKASVLMHNGITLTKGMREALELNLQNLKD